MKDIIRLLPNCIYAKTCGHHCALAGTGDAYPLMTVKAGEAKGEMIVTCHNFRKKPEGQQPEGY